MKRVLVVDDSELQRSIVIDALSGLPCQVVGEAADGGQAVDKVRDLAPDLVFLDMEMPGGTGLDALRAIKAIAPGTVVFMITSIESSAVIDDCLAAGAEDYIRKDKLETLADRVGGHFAD